MTLIQQCVVLFFLGLAFDLMQTLHIQACAERKMFGAISTLLAITALGFFWHLWFIENDDMLGRVWLTASSAAGACLGTWLVIRYTKTPEKLS